MHTRFSCRTNEEVLLLVYLRNYSPDDLGDLVAELAARLEATMPKHKAVTMMDQMPKQLQEHFRGW